MRSTVPEFRVPRVGAAGEVGCPSTGSRRRVRLELACPRLTGRFPANPKICPSSTHRTMPHVATFTPLAQKSAQTKSLVQTYLSLNFALQLPSRCTKTVLPVSRFFFQSRVRSKMTGMGALLAAVALAVPLTAWFRGTDLLSNFQYRLAPTPSAPRENGPRSWNSKSSMTQRPLR